MIAVLTDDRYEDRLPMLRWELDRQGITEYKLFRPIKEGAKSVMHSINISHKNIVRYAKDNLLDSITIFEDDVMFPAVDGFSRYMSLTPESYDIYLGGCYNFNLKPGNIVENFTATHCYTVHSRFFDKFLAASEDVHIDTALNGLGTYVLHYPIVAIQRPGYSANNLGFADHNQMLKKEDVYGWAPAAG